ncbi:NADPH:quinone reductase [Actinocatenispora thailandica]|uniref:NADPH:quinone reductase n=1 Tax=Actinocatenispora thailandica TaxID=227318 RepID=A0A7R7DL82_9ACTN|nr:zinc-binding dehydrogenase [Actinocatenispora thailandica]BCJ33541.1 NADPH:quinone reductase [Actinocatenispora thailandica]
MRAVLQRQWGGPGVLRIERVPDPVPAPGQVSIAAQACPITFVETQIRAGGGPPAARQLPYVPGNGTAGVVRAVGPGAPGELVGRRVVAVTGGSGGYAELAVVPVEELIDVPAAVPLDDAAALLADGRTAIALAAAARIRAGDRVLVLAAGGGLGSLLVQLARNAGAEVVGAAGSAAKRALAGRVGAAAVVDYTADGWADRVGAVDVVFDGVGGALGAAAFPLARAGARYVVHGAASGAMSTPPTDAGVEVVPLSAVSFGAGGARARSAEALALAAAGRLRPTIGQRFALAEAAAAHAAIETRRTLGKTLLVP